MLTSKIQCLVVLIFINFVYCDEFHPKPSIDIAPHLEYSEIDAALKDLEGYSEYWVEKAQNYIAEELKVKLNTNKAKNIIMFIGDGLSLTTTAAARVYLGGEEQKLSYENFPYFGLSKTYCIDRQVPDSACTATAFLHGIKNNYRGLGVTANVSSSQCTFSDDDITYSIAKWAQDAGKATGIVTTTRVTHATPAGVYAHSPHRDWENNAAISSACRNNPESRIVDIAHQLVYNEEAKKFKVILGGGRRHFINTTALDEEGRAGARSDGRNLIDEWLDERNKDGSAQYIWHKQQLDEINFENTDYLLGLFENDHCMYRLDVLNNNLQAQEPMLTDMTRAAIRMLQKDENKDGFFLMVEGGRIDHAHHSNYARKSLDETAEFARAIEMAKLLTNQEDTLIVVSSDHSHVMTYNGYPIRHNDILKIAGRGDEEPIRLSYETLSYANGPGYNRTYPDGLRFDVANDNFADVNRRYQATVPLSSETHGGEDVGVYADGPWAHLFQGSYEQSYIPHIIAYAAKIGAYKELAEETTPPPSTLPTTTCENEDCTDSANAIYTFPALMLLSILIFKLF